MKERVREERRGGERDKQIKSLRRSKESTIRKREEGTLKDCATNKEEKKKGCTYHPYHDKSCPAVFVAEK